MNERWRRAWASFWFRPEAPLGVVAVRGIVAANALWIVLSRLDLPEVLGWPAAFWSLAPTPLRMRYLVFGLPLEAERLLFLTLIAALGAALLGLAPRASCALSALLLYHFAPLEELVVGTRALWFRGLTIPILALFIVAFAAAPERGRSPEHRWPVALIQVLFASTYFFALVGKLYQSGPSWFSAGNIRDFAVFAATFGSVPPLAVWLATSPLVCAFVAGATFVLELLFPLVPFSRRAASLLVPAALVGHVGIALSLGIVYLNAPLLLVFLDWGALARRLSRSGPEGAAPAPSA